MPTMLQPDSPPRWLVSVIGDHQPSDDTMAFCQCSYRNLDEKYRPKKLIEWTPEHLATEIHNCLANAIQNLITEGSKTNAADEL